MGVHLIQHKILNHYHDLKRPYLVQPLINCLSSLSLVTSFLLSCHIGLLAFLKLGQQWFCLSTSCCSFTLNVLSPNTDIENFFPYILTYLPHFKNISAHMLSSLEALLYHPFRNKSFHSLSHHLSFIFIKKPTTPK